MASSIVSIAQLEHWLEDLVRKWERFVSRDPKVPVPPDRERAALERRLRELSRGDFRPAEQFKLEQLLARFSTYNHLWQRQLREREEARTGGRPAAGRSSASPAPPPPPGPAPAPNATAAAPVGATGDVETLHARYTAALTEAGGRAAVPLDRFREVIERQKQALAAKGVVVEGFDVVREGAEVKLKARVRRGRNE